MKIYAWIIHIITFVWLLNQLHRSICCFNLLSYILILNLLFCKYLLIMILLLKNQHLLFILPLIWILPFGIPVLKCTIDLSICLIFRLPIQRINIIYFYRVQLPCYTCFINRCQFHYWFLVLLAKLLIIYSFWNICNVLI